MRFLHTADWHVGKGLRGRSRMDEHAAALDQVARVALDAKVDAVLVAGDVFDSPAPAPDAEKLVFDFLARLVAARVACVVIAGNHDHPKKLGALAALVEGLRIHVRPEVRPPLDGGIVCVPSRDGSTEARVAVLPFVPERRIVDACLVMNQEDLCHDEYARRLEGILAALVAPLTPATVNLVLAHVLVEGARPGTGERELHLRQSYGIRSQQLPSSVQYVGLGHLHRPQQVQGAAAAVYAGSLLELDFGESEQDKRVVVIEARPNAAARLESVPITAGRPLRDAVGTLAELQAMAPTLANAFLRVKVRADAPTPGLADCVRQLLPDALEVAVDHPRLTPVAEPAGSRQALEPAQLFAAYYERRNGQPPSPELSGLFDELHEEASR